jgi:hypothetical protein
MIILDTNVVSELMRQSPARWSSRGCASRPAPSCSRPGTGADPRRHPGRRYARPSPTSAYRPHRTVEHGKGRRSETPKVRGIGPTPLVAAVAGRASTTPGKPAQQDGPPFTRGARCSVVAATRSPNGWPHQMRRPPSRSSNAARRTGRLGRGCRLTTPSCRRRAPSARPASPRPNPAAGHHLIRPSHRIPATASRRVATRRLFGAAVSRRLWRPWTGVKVGRG